MAVSNYKILKQVLANRVMFEQCNKEYKGFRPIDVELRLNWECNAKCKMCGVHDYFSNGSEARKQNLNYQEIVLLLDQLKVMGCAGVTLSGGEPTLRKDLVSIVRYASQTCNLNVSLNTNGFMLEKSFLQALIDAGIDGFTLSLDSPVEKIHDHIRGLQNSYKRIINAIDYINHYVSANPSRKIFIFVNSVILKDNIASLQGFKKLHETHKFHHLNFSPASISTHWDEWTTENSELRPSIDDVLLLKEMIANEFSKDSELQVEDPFGDTLDEIKRNLHVEFSNRSRACFVPMVHAVVQCNGDVIPCCYAPDNFVLGNIREKSFSEVWDGKLYSSFREHCRKADYDMCVSCRQYKLLNNKIQEKISGGN